MKKIKSFEEALESTGRPNVDFSNLPDDLRSYFENQYKAVVITEAINDGWVADYSNSNQRKWFPVFYMSPSGFVFLLADYRYSGAYAGGTSRLCFETEAAAIFAGKTFTEIYQGIVLGQ
jgi:hypothetical protein